MAEPNSRAPLVGLALLLILLATGAARWRLLDVPLERDEGEYAYAGRLLLEGVAPYDRAYNMKLPGIYGVYAATMAVFGETRRGIHLGLLVANAASIALVFALGRRLLDAGAGLAAAATFALLSLGIPVQGAFANAEHFVLPFALGGLLLLLDAERAGRLVAGALLLGLALLVKQHGAAFALAGGVLVVRRRGARGLLPFAGALAAPYLLTCALLAAAGVFERFWFWTVRYAFAYATRIPLEVGLDQLARNGGALVAAAPLTFALAAVGLASFAFDGRVRAAGWALGAIVLASLLAVCPGLLFRPHYFVLALPAVGLLVGAAAVAIARRAQPVVGALVVVLALGAAAWGQRAYLTAMTPTEVARATYGLNPFPESIDVGRFIAERTEPGDVIAVIGSEPQICFYADRRSATGYMYTYPLMEDQPFAEAQQREFIAEVEAARPAMLVLVTASSSWLRRPGSKTLVLEWAERYRRDYDLVGVVDLQRPEAGVIEAPDGRPALGLEIYARRGTG